MQSVSSKIWTRVAVSISYDDNHYTTGTSKTGWYAVKVKQSIINYVPIHYLLSVNVKQALIFITGENA